jgi:hypothetical protein
MTRVSHDTVPPLASGLKDGWKSKSKSKTKSHTPDEPAIGGLTDKHALSVKPKTGKGIAGSVVGVSTMFVSCFLFHD